MENERLVELLNRTLVVVAHPDDEAIGAGALLRRMREAAVVFCTDGGPRDPYFWGRYGSRENYVQVRRRETDAVMRMAGVRRTHFLPITDQHLYQNLPLAFEELDRITGDFQPDAILTLAYEGGHPDHDSCAFLSYLLGKQHHLPVWEMALYHRKQDGPHCQDFLYPELIGVPLEMSPQELDAKKKMVKLYISQGEALQNFVFSYECFRRQPPYDFRKPPEAEIINYEEWQWTMKATEVAAAFAGFLDARNGTGELE